MFISLRPNYNDFLNSRRMRYTLFVAFLMNVFLAWATPRDIPVTFIDLGKTPPIKRSVVYIPKVTIDMNMLTVDYPYSGDIEVEVFEEGETVWSETSSSDTFILPELREGTEYTLVITINGKSWYGVFTYHEQ